VNATRSCLRHRFLTAYIHLTKKISANLLFKIGHSRVNCSGIGRTSSIKATFRKFYLMQTRGLHQYLSRREAEVHRMVGSAFWECVCHELL
jgi:hypothetical protein